MKCFLRPYLYAGAGLLAIATVSFSPGALGQPGISNLVKGLKPLLSHSSPGYLGVYVTNVDNDSVQKLRLKDSKGALITLIDHDAPAGSALHLNDVILSVNGETIDGAEHFGRLLKEIPAGKKVTFLISRDGAQQSITIQLVDRKAMEQEVWNKVNSSSFPPPPRGMGILSGSGSDVGSGGYAPLFTSSLNVGAMVEPLAGQMADYLGVSAGVMVKQVARRSEADVAGLKAHDVILKVGNDFITTSADWDRALRSNQGKAVQVTVLRDRRQQVLTLQVDSKHHRSSVVWTDMIDDSALPEVAVLDPQFVSGLAAQLDAEAQRFRMEFNPQQIEELRRQGEELSKQFEAGKFPGVKIDPKAMEDLKRQMEEFSKSFNADAFKIDPKAMEELRKEMEQFRQSFSPDDFKIDPKQMEELNRELEQFRQNFHFDGQQLNRLEAPSTGNHA